MLGFAFLTARSFVRSALVKYPLASITTEPDVKSGL